MLRSVRFWVRLLFSRDWWRMKRGEWTAPSCPICLQRLRFARVYPDRDSYFCQPCIQSAAKRWVFCYRGEQPVVKECGEK